MGKLIMWNLVSLDGMFEGATPWALDWFQRGFDEAAIAHVVGQLRTTGALVFGRKTYEGMFAHWHSAAGEIADYMNTLPKTVFSRTLTGSDWQNTRVVAEDPASVIADLKARMRGDIYVFGSADLSAALMDADLFDEYRFGLTPVVLGRGTRLFGGSAAPRELALIEARPINASLLLLRYGRASMA
jgi:dihydrofolate reductase